MSGKDEARDITLYERLQLTGPLSYATLFDYLYCLLASAVLVDQGLLGGALYISAQVGGMAVGLLQPGRLKDLPRSYRLTGVLITMAAGLTAFALMLIYPARVEEPHLWVLFGVVVMVKLRSYLARYLRHYALSHGLSRVQALFRQAEVTLLCSLLMAPLLFLTLPADTAWYFLGGYAILAILEGYALFSSPARLPTATRPKPEPEQLSHAKAYLSFRRLSAFTLTALQVTLFLSYTLIGSTAGDLLLCMGIALVFTYVPGRLTRALLARQRNRHRDPSNVLLAGLFLWLMSLVMLALYLTKGSRLWPLLALASCTAGTTVAMSALQALEGYIEPIVRFATGREPDTSQDSLRALEAAYATMAGQTIALIGLSLMLFFRGGSPAIDRVQPTLLIPALVLVIMALLAALRYPMESQHMMKLQRFLLLTDQGETNLPLQQQLEQVVMRASRRHYGIKLLIILLRPMFYSKVMGREHVKLDRDTACVFTCNHGELYGPIVANLFVPYSFRPWVISEMAELPEIANYIYTYTVKRQRWLPESWKMPVSRLVAPLLAWVMRSIECIPVYRNKPHELMKTLRLSAQAMEAGDNLLIFPENPNEPSLKKAGYLRDSIGPFFHGFVTVAQLYERRTGKCAQFYPIYADKKRRLLTFGQPVRYDASQHPALEQERISNHLRSEMLRMAGLSEEGS